MPLIIPNRNAIVRSTPSLKHLALCYRKATAMNGMSYLGRSFIARQQSSFTRSPFSSSVSELGHRLASGTPTTSSRRLKSTVAPREPLLFTWAKTLQNRAEAAAVTLQKWATTSAQPSLPQHTTNTTTTTSFEPPKMSTEARNAVFTWVNSPHAESSPEGWLLDDLAQQVRDNIPSMVLYTYMLNLCAHSSQANAGRKALRLLNEMHDKGMNPDGITYSLVLDAWTRSEPKDAGIMTQVLWNEMQDNNVEPALETYKASINAWAKSGAFEAGERAEQLARDMQARGIQPNADTYTLVIEAWAQAGVADGYKNRTE